MRTTILTLSLLLLAAGCATVEPPAPQPGREDPEKVAAGGEGRPEARLDERERERERDRDRDREEDEEEAERGDVEAVAGALDQVLDRGAARRSFHLEMGCITDAGFRSLELYNNGVAIWNNESQFQLTDPEIGSLLELLRRYEFADLRLSYGAKEEDSAIMVLCYLELDLNGVSKTVNQLYGGEQSQPFRQLADEIMAYVAPFAERGVRADSMEEALAKIERGELAPEAFHLLLHRKGEQGGGDPGWLFRLDGLRASARRYLADSGLDDAVELELSPEELSQVARDLVTAGVDRLPRNLWAGEYTDLVLEVLKYKINIQARQFAGMTPETHGAFQGAFDTLYGQLDEVVQRVLAQGQRQADRP